MDELNSKKISNAILDTDLTKQIKEKQEQITAKQTEIAKQETEINQVVQEILTKKREELKKYEIAKGFKKVDTNDQRRGFFDLYDIQSLLLEIRYLEQEGDTTQPSSNAEENTAFTSVSEILTEVDKYCLVNNFQNLAYVSGGNGKHDNQQAINRIKAGKYTDSKGQEYQISSSLEKFKAHFTKKAELVKLNDWETTALKALEIALGEQQDQTEKLTDWQTKLKVLDNSLDETIITEEFKSKWNKINKFKNIAQVEELLKKIIGADQKVKSDFLVEIQKKDAKLTDLKTLLAKEPKEVITLIIRYEYDKDSQDNQQKTVKMIKMNMSKKKEDDLTKEEITTGLYKLAVGEYSSKTTAEIEKWEKGEEQDNDNNQQKPEKSFFRMNNPWLWGIIGLSVATVVGIVYYFFFHSKTEAKSEATETDETAQEE